LNDLIKHRGTILDRACKDLEQVSILIPIDQDIEFLELVQILINFAYTIQNSCIINFRNV
jgi:hypothetical protein